MPQMEKRQKKNEFHLKTNASLTKSKRARRNGFVGKISERKRRVNDDEWHPTTKTAAAATTIQRQQMWMCVCVCGFSCNMTCSDCCCSLPTRHLLLLLLHVLPVHVHVNNNNPRLKGRSRLYLGPLFLTRRRRRRNDYVKPIILDRVFSLFRVLSGHQLCLLLCPHLGGRRHPRLFFFCFVFRPNFTAAAAVVIFVLFCCCF